MKTKNLLTIFAVFFLMFHSAEAQFLKKLKKRVEQKVENAVIEKTANKASEKATKSMDKAFETNPFGRGAGKGKADPALVANSYDFTWKYSLKMSTKEGEILFDYYLKPDESYFGFTSAMMENMFNVMDTDKNIMVMFMKSVDNNIGMVTQMPDDMMSEESQSNSENFKFETLPNKTINGFLCKGVKGYNSEYEMIMYFTNETEVSFNDMFKSSKTKIPVEFQNYFNPKDKVLMIFMDMKNLKDKNKSATMECVGLEKVKKTIKKSDYKFM